MTLEEMVGQHLMIGIHGSKITPEIIRLFQDSHAGGLIIFRPNFQSSKSFKELISKLERALGRSLLIAVDHEGGRVIHLAEDITVFPDNLALGQTQNAEFASRQGEIEALELRRLGIDLNLAPTLDVLTDAFSPNIGIRSYGKDPKLVSRLGCARIKAMQQLGLSACAKHFPGQGHSTMDAHLGLPVLRSDRKEMEEKHLRPFAEAIKAGVDTIMTSHPVYPDLDPSFVPATFSKLIVRDLLRNKMKFNGVIMSDDLEMGALKDISSVPKSAVKAVSAGHDIVLICHDYEAVAQAHDHLLTAYKNGSLKISDLEKSLERISKLKSRRGERFTYGAPQREEGGEKIANLIAEKSIKWNGEPLDPVRQVSVIFPKLSSLADRIFIELRMLNEGKFLRDLFLDMGIRAVDIKIIELDPSAEDILSIQALASKSSDLLIYFCFDAHIYSSCKKIMEIVENREGENAVVFMRDPYDWQYVKTGIRWTNADGFRSCQITSAIKHIFRSNIVLNKVIN